MNSSSEIIVSREVRVVFIAPLGSTIALGSNRLKRMLEITPQRQWRQDQRGGS